MKNMKSLLYILAALTSTCLFTSTTNAQGSTAFPDTSVVIPIKDFPIANTKVVGDKKTGLLTVSIELENVWLNSVDASLSIGGWENFGFVSDKGDKYKVYTYYNKLTDDNPNKGFKQVTNARFGEKVMDLATVLAQSFLPGQKKVLVFKVSNYDRLSKSISEIHFRCVHYYQYGGGINSSGLYKLYHIAIDWK